MSNYINRSPAPITPGLTKIRSKHNERNYYSVISVRETAHGRWPQILESLGISFTYLKNKHGACPICREGIDRFRFDDKGIGAYFCNKCGAGDGFQLLQRYHNWGFAYALEMVGRTLGIRPDGYDNQPKHITHYLSKISTPTQTSTNDEVANRKRKLNSIWQAAMPVAFGDPVDCYLKSRGIQLEAPPSVLRCHPSLPYYNERRELLGTFPAMLAMVKDKNDRSVTLHRTYLSNNGKADVPKPKKLMSPIMPGTTRGAAIKLFEPVNGALALSEGIENALSYYSVMGLPAWAAISAGTMEKIILPASVKTVTLLVDNDERGLQAALTLSRRLSAEGRTVTRIIPPMIGHDINDMLLGGGR